MEKITLNITSVEIANNEKRHFTSVNDLLSCAMDGDFYYTTLKECSTLEEARKELKEVSGLTFHDYGRYYEIEIAFIMIEYFNDDDEIENVEYHDFKIKPAHLDANDKVVFDLEY